MAVNVSMSDVLTGGSHHVVLAPFGGWEWLVSGAAVMVQLRVQTVNAASKLWQYMSSCAIKGWQFSWRNLWH